MDEQQITPLLMPKWGLSMNEGLFSGWLVEEGDEIAVGDEIMEVETDKIANVVEAADAGLLRRCIAVADEIYPVQALLGVLAPEQVSDAQVDAFIETYEVPVVEDDDTADTAPPYEFVETPVGRLRFTIRGQGPELLLIHGFGGDLDNWLFNIDVLAARARVYALDLPGHGQSEKRIADPGLMGLASAVRAFMDAVDLKAAHLIGHSLGAAVAARLAVMAPDRVSSLTLISAAGLGPEIDSSYIHGFVEAVSRRELKPQLQKLFSDPGLVNRGMIDDLLKFKRLDGVRDSLSALAEALFGDAGQSELVGDEVADLGKEILVIWGEDDKIIPAAHAYSIQGAQVEIIEKAGHMVQMEQAATVNDLILGHVTNDRADDR